MAGELSPFAGDVGELLSSMAWRPAESERERTPTGDPDTGRRCSGSYEGPSSMSWSWSHLRPPSLSAPKVTPSSTRDPNGLTGDARERERERERRPSEGGEGTPTGEPVRTVGPPRRGGEVTAVTKVLHRLGPTRGTQWGATCVGLAGTALFLSAQNAAHRRLGREH